MLALSAIQTTVAAAISAAPYFVTGTPAGQFSASVPVIVDDGNQHSAIEAGLRDKGFVVVLPPILSAARADQGGHTRTALLNAEFVVRLLVNVEVNTSSIGANRNLYDAITAATAAVLAITPASGDRRFEASPGFLTLVTYDDGLVGYDLAFSKLSAVN